MVVKDEGGPDRVETRQTGALLTCLKELGKRSQLPRLLHWRAIGALALCRAKRRIPITSSRCRQRQ